ncbi:MAG: hypothetical protein ACXWT1_19870, partial [Methylobacter sp.]
MSFPRYSSYKDSGIEWLGEAPEHWTSSPQPLSHQGRGAIKRIVSIDCVDASLVFVFADSKTAKPGTPPSSERAANSPLSLRERGRELVSFRRYESYKDSGVEWLGEVPEHWEVVRLKTLLAEVDNRAGDQDLELLGLSKSLGIVRRSELEQGASASDNYAKYKIVTSGQLVMNKMQAWNGVFGLSPVTGTVSPDYAVFRFMKEGLDKYLCSLFRTEIMSGVFFTRCRGMGTAFLRLNTPDLFDIKVPLPTPADAAYISAFLDRETAKIDALIAEQQRLIELLKEKRQAVISHA